MNDSHSSTASSFPNDGARDEPEHRRIGGGEHQDREVTSSGRRPTRSESAPMTGSQNRFEAPTHSVTIRLSMLGEVQHGAAEGRRIRRDHVERHRRHRDEQRADERRAAQLAASDRRIPRVSGWCRRAQELVGLVERARGARTGTA